MPHRHFLLAAWVLLAPTQAEAKCAKWDAAAAFNDAQTVALVEITEAHIEVNRDKFHRIGFSARYHVTELFKGSAEDSSVRYLLWPESLIVTPGKIYLLFLSQEKVLCICNGDREMGFSARPQSPEDKTFLETLRKWKRYEL